VWKKSGRIKNSRKLKTTFVCAVIGVVAVGLLVHISFARASNIVWQQYTYDSPVGSRPYFVYTPQNYRVGTAVPLIMMLHGCRQTAVDFATGTHMNQLAEEYNFIVVYPQQTSKASINGCWNWYDPVHQFRDGGEPSILAGIVLAIEENTTQWTIDSCRVYVTGISAGAAMSVILGATYPDIFAAVGVHSGVEYRAATGLKDLLSAMRRGGPNPARQGKAAYDAMGSLARVVPTIVFQGTSDVIVNRVNGDQVVQQWMQTARLASHGIYAADFVNPTSVTTDLAPGGRTYIVYRWCDSNGNEVQVYWRVNGLGHAWSGGNGASFTDPRGPDASLAMYTFFMKHPMGRYLASEHAGRIVSAWRNFRRALAVRSK
jgi:poly(hydroxyalkanoate) depolymerase family esterase